jgi:4-cresol dehydrogenase (hydroxylating) flavoprotein subunit
VRRIMNRRRKVFEGEVSCWLRPGGVAESLCGNRRERCGVLQPETVEDVQRIVSAASKASGEVKLQPISCGKNWGFGSNLASEDGVYMLDLSALDAIRSLDLESHSVELEPGVTQGQLYETLSREGNTHYFNVTGAGLRTSIIGNALERGIGYFGQRHLDVLDLEIVLPSGERTRTSRLQAEFVKPSSGGLGPDPSGLFFQSNFAVVTAATIALQRRPEVLGGILCAISDPDLLEPLVTAISDLMAEGACYGAPHVFNRERVVTTLSPHLNQAQAAQFSSSVGPWTALIPIRGSKAVFAASAQELQARLRSLGNIQVIADDRQSDGNLGGLLHGQPSDFALASVAYSVFGHCSALNAPLEATGAGLIHVAPIVAFRGQTIRELERLTHETLRRHYRESVPLSLNVLSARTAALIVSLGFDRRSALNAAAAHRAADDLLQSYLRAGLMPYRLGLGQAEQLPPMAGPWPKIFRNIQQILDPQGCMASSRYDALWRRESAAKAPETSKMLEACA